MFWWLQTEADVNNYDLFEVNRTPGKGVLNRKGKPRLYPVCLRACACVRVRVFSVRLYV